MRCLVCVCVFFFFFFVVVVVVSLHCGHRCLHRTKVGKVFPSISSRRSQFSLWFIFGRPKFWVTQKNTLENELSWNLKKLEVDGSNDFFGISI